MEKEVYIILTRGSDGYFIISTYETLEKAQEVMQRNIDAQKEIEGVGEWGVYVDYHHPQLEKLTVPGFLVRDRDIMGHSTVFIYSAPGEQKIRTDRYIIRSKME